MEAVTYGRKIVRFAVKWDNGNRPPGSRDSNDWTVVVKQDLIVIMPCRLVCNTVETTK
jgi:hypothetical protein